MTEEYMSDDDMQRLQVALANAGVPKVCPECGGSRGLAPVYGWLLLTTEPPTERITPPNKGRHMCIFECTNCGLTTLYSARMLYDRLEAARSRA